MGWRVIRPLHILWVIHAYQWLPGYLIQPLPGERPGVLPHVYFYRGDFGSIVIYKQLEDVCGVVFENIMSL